jgi:predicted nucleic acid-binding protein
LIALDTSSLVHYLAGSTGKDVGAVDEALSHSQACLPPVVLSEVLSDPKLPQRLEDALLRIPVLSLGPGYWERAGRLRALVIKGGHKAKLADTLIAQVCLDHEVPLVTRDSDFRHFGAAGLRIIP